MLAAGLPEQPRRDPRPPGGPTSVPHALVVAVGGVEVGGQLHFHDVVDVQAEVRERLGRAADLAFVVRPLRPVLEAAHRDVTEDDVAVTAHMNHVQEVVRVQRNRGADGDVREEGAGELGADLGHGRMVTAGSDSEDVRGITRGSDSGSDWRFGCLGVESSARG
jgi:hypothetical protein